MPVVRHYQQSSLILQQGALDDFAGILVEMIRGFIKNQKVSLLEHELVECQPGLLSAG